VNQDFAILDDMWLFNMNNQTMKALSKNIEKPSPRKEAVGYSCDHDLFVIVGGTKKDSNSDKPVITGEMFYFSNLKSSSSEQEFSGQWAQYQHEGEKWTARTGHTGACIRDNQYLVMFGGERADGTFSNEVTVFNGAEWVNIPHHPSSDAPSPRKYASIASVPIRDAHGYQIDDSIVLFGGLLKPSGVDREFWQFRFSTRTWTLLSNGTLAGEAYPEPRNTQNMFYDSKMNQLVMFGGEDAKANGMNDLWTYSFASRVWTNIETPAQPPARLGSGGVLLNAQPLSLAVFGGISGWTKASGKRVLGDMWHLKTATTSSRIHPPTTPTYSNIHRLHHHRTNKHKNNKRFKFA